MKPSFNKRLGYPRQRILLVELEKFAATSLLKDLTLVENRKVQVFQNVGVVEVSFSKTEGVGCSCRREVCGLIHVQ